MSRDRAQGGRRPAGGPRSVSPSGPVPGLELEALVHLVLALGGERAGALLSGLADPLRRRALALRRSAERRSRAERHAILAVAFASREAGSGAARDIPGALGDRVRAVLARADVPPGAGALERWARRLARELADEA